MSWSRPALQLRPRTRRPGPACNAPARIKRRRLRISRQVIREYLATVTRPQSWSAPLAMAEALGDVSRLTTYFDVLEDGPQVTDILTSLCSAVQVAGRQIHDANIVATMLAHGERRLLTFNQRDFRRYGARIDLINMELEP